MDAVSAAQDGNIQMIGSSSVRVHQHAANSKSGGDRCMGRSRGGLTTKIHVLADAKGLLLELVLPGQAARLSRRGEAAWKPARKNHPARRQGL
jgi:hypothetical protein